MNQNAPAQALAALAEQYWDFESFESPFSALLAGEKTHDATLFRESPADYDRKAATAATLLQTLNGIADQPLDAQDMATAKLMQRELRKIVDFHEVKAHLRPSLYPAGPDFNLRYWANSAHANSSEAARQYLDRLATVTAFLGDLRASLEAGREFGFRYPSFVLERATAAVRAGIAPSAADSPLMGPFQRSPLGESPAVREAAVQAAGLIDNKILPALSDYATFLEQDLGPSGRDSIACADDPLGEEYYELLVRNFTSLDAEADEIHQLGLDEVERVHADIESVATEAGFNGDVAAYQQYVTQDPAFVSPDPATHLQAVQVICKEIDLLVPSFFSQVPRITYGVRLIPEALSDSMPPAYAQPSPADNSAPGVFWLSGIPAKCPTWFYRSLALHEAWPGHLMQIALMQEQMDLPKFRRNGALKYTACIEGWAMYCESLGTEMGIYQSPHDHFGRLLGEMWRAVRLVVDTGIHARNWSRQKALQYAVERVAIPVETLEAEIDRYIALPGQALAYQPGNLKFRELRRRAESRLGDQFDVRQFHNQLISCGPVTLPILDQLMEHWMATQGEAA
ncbi:MAG: DUF885 domain-containing protein [Xanthomonadales bacterium]|nr:DUF885 domain-containing protein [Xanthomonadales bacterium]